MDQGIVSTTHGLFAVDMESGNIACQFNDSHASVVCPVGSDFQGGAAGTRLVCAPQLSKGLLHYWRLNADSGLPESSGNPTYKCSSPEKFSALAFSHCGGLMFAGTATGTIYVWQTYTGNLLKSWTGHFGPVTQIRVSQDDAHLFTASEDTTVKMYFLPSVFDAELSKRSPVPVPEHTFAGHSDKVTDFVICGTDKLITGSEDKSVKVFSLAEARGQIDQVLLPCAVTCLAATHIGDVVVGCVDGSVFLHTAEATEPLLAKHAGAVSGVGLSTDCSRAMTCGADGVKIWDLRSRVLVMSVVGPNQQLKDSLGLAVIRKPIVVSDSVRVELEKSAADKKLVSSIDAYLQLKPLQRTLTPVETLDVVPLICMWASGPVPKVKNGVCLDAKLVSGGIPVDPLLKAQDEVAKLRESTKAWATTCADLYARLSTFTTDVHLALRLNGAPVEPNNVAPAAPTAAATKKRKTSR